MAAWLVEPSTSWPPAKPLDRDTVAAAVEVGDGTQGRLVITQQGRAAESEHARAGVVVARDACLGAEAEHILSGDKAAGQGDGGADQVGTVRVGDGEAGVDGSGRLVLRVAEGTARGGHYWRYIAGVDQHLEGAGDVAEVIAVHRDRDGEGAGGDVHVVARDRAQDLIHGAHVDLSVTPVDT